MHDLFLIQKCTNIHINYIKLNVIIGPIRCLFFGIYKMNEFTILFCFIFFLYWEIQYNRRFIHSVHSVCAWINFKFYFVLFFFSYWEIQYNRRFTVYIKILISDERVPCETNPLNSEWPAFGKMSFLSVSLKLPFNDTVTQGPRNKDKLLALRPNSRD